MRQAVAVVFAVFDALLFGVRQDLGFDGKEERTHDPAPAERDAPNSPQTRTVGQIEQGRFEAIVEMMGGGDPVKSFVVGERSQPVVAQLPGCGLYRQAVVGGIARRIEALLEIRYAPGCGSSGNQVGVELRLGAPQSVTAVRQRKEIIG